VTLESSERRDAVVRVRLYIAGDAPNSIAAVANLRATLARHAGHAIEVETIDVLRDPLRALQDAVLVTPMLVRSEPLPERRILGNLHDRQTLLGALGLDETPHDE
jgi:circadian clock protein KaiB